MVLQICTASLRGHGGRSCSAAAGTERVNLFPIHQFMGKEYNALASFVWAAARTTGSYNRQKSEHVTPLGSQPFSLYVVRPNVKSLGCEYAIYYIQQRHACKSLLLVPLLCATLNESLLLHLIVFEKELCHLTDTNSSSVYCQQLRSSHGSVTFCRMHACQPLHSYLVNLGRPFLTTHVDELTVLDCGAGSSSFRALNGKSTIKRRCHEERSRPQPSLACTAVREVQSALNSCSILD